MARPGAPHKTKLQGKHTVRLPENQMPKWMVVWFYVTGIICTIDASFVVFRPHTLPGGFLNKYFRFSTISETEYYMNMSENCVLAAYVCLIVDNLYIYTDQRYNDVNDSYSFTQSLMNYAEVVLNVITLIYHYRRSSQTNILAFTVSVMTFWKTVLYIAMFYELAGGKDFRSGNTLLEEILIVLIPNGVWILLPFMCMVDLWKKLTNPTINATNSNMNKTD